MMFKSFHFHVSFSFIAKFGWIFLQMISTWKLVYTPHHKIEKRKEKKKKEASCKSEPQKKLWCEFFSLEDKHLTYFLQIMTWMDSHRCFYVPIERWTWREGRHWKLHNLIQVGVFFKISMKGKLLFFLYWLGPYQNILNALFQVQPNFSSPINKK